VRHSLLLSTMSDGHVRRSKPSKAGHAARRRRRVWLLSVPLPVALVAPAIWYVAIPSPALHDQIETAIRQAGFDPVQPPSRLRGPGALYVVEGGSYRKVCDAEPDLLDGKIQKSPTESQSRESLETGKFSLGGEFMRSLNAQFGGTRVNSIEYKLSDVTISEISLSDLHGIENVLLQRKQCDETVGRLLDAKKKVCSGYAALSATATYQVHIEAKFLSESSSKPGTIKTVQQALQEHTQGEVRQTADEELAGDDLFYGIQLSPLCITPNTATEPSLLADTEKPQRGSNAGGT
jgi:hypothetical protein